MKWLTSKLIFPPLQEASDEGLLAVGGDLSVERLILAYSSGVFPWFDEQSPILWWSPDPRFVLFPKRLKVPKSMRQFMRNSNLQITINKDFAAVIDNCAAVYRPGQGGTWIGPEMIEAYTKLHQLGYAKSVEVWQDGELVGGLYGIDLGNGVFCGESMFTKLSNASKAGFIYFIEKTNYKLIDCQVYTKHLESLGAESMSRSQFLGYLD